MEAWSQFSAVKGGSFKKCSPSGMSSGPWAWALDHRLQAARAVYHPVQIHLIFIETHGVHIYSHLC